jgi:glycerol-3-phosphate acyltransferase PlsY
MMIAVEIFFCLIAYLAGSIPFGYLFTKKYTGKNIRELGSGNIGSTNVKRVAGGKIALYTQLCDMAKGFLPVGIVWFLQTYNIVAFDEFFIYAVALASILGHNFSIFLKFKGGKGVNTTLGASLLLSPIAVLTSVLVYYIIKWSTKYVSLGSICLAISLPIVVLVQHKSNFLFYYFVTCFVLITLRHIPNIMRLTKGIETKST